MHIETLHCPKMEIERSTTEDDKFIILFEDEDNHVLVRLSDFQGQVLCALVNRTVIRKTHYEHTGLTRNGTYQIVMNFRGTPGASKIDTIIALRSFIDIGLKDAKNAVEQSEDIPRVIMTYRAREFAQAIVNAIPENIREFFSISEVPYE